MRILVISQYFWPENFRVNDLCQELVKKGHEVTVLTGIPNYPEGKVLKCFKKDRHLYDSYEGVEVIRVPIILRRTNKFHLILNYISFMISGSIHVIFKLRKREFDMVYLHQLSPIFSVIPGIVYSKLKKVPTIMWIFDLWPDSLKIIGIKNKLVHAIVNQLVKSIYKGCDRILVQSRAFISPISTSYPSERIWYLPNWAEACFEVNPSTQKKIEPIRFLFAGNIGEAQDLENVIRAFYLANKKGLDFSFELAGDGRDRRKLQDLVKTLNLEQKIHFLGNLPLKSMPELYDKADVLLVSLKSGSHFSKTIPGKLQSYMAARKPVLGMISGEGKSVIEESNCGFVSEAGDIKVFINHLFSFVRLTQSQMNRLGLNGYEYYKNNFDREKLINDFIHHLSELHAARCS